MADRKELLVDSLKTIKVSFKDDFIVVNAKCHGKSKKFKFLYSWKIRFKYKKRSVTINFLDYDNEVLVLSYVFNYLLEKFKFGLQDYEEVRRFFLFVNEEKHLKCRRIVNKFLYLFGNLFQDFIGFMQDFC